MTYKKTSKNEANPVVDHDGNEAINSLTEEHLEAYHHEDVCNDTEYKVEHGLFISAKVVPLFWML